MLITLRRFFAKDARERRVALSTLLAAPLVKIVLRTRDYAGTVRFLTRMSRAPFAGIDQAVADARVAQAVIRRLPFDLTCLERSLVVWWLSPGCHQGGSNRCDSLPFGTSGCTSLPLVPNRRQTMPAMRIGISVTT